MRSVSLPVLAALASSVVAAAAVACSSSGGDDGGTTADASTDATSGDAATEAGGSADAGSSGGACGNLPDATVVAHTTAPLAVAADPGAPADAGPSLGIYDPSLLYPPSAPGGVMSYSAVSANDVHTRVAVTTDHGASFTFVAEVNHAEPTTIATSEPAVCGAASCPAVLWHEVSSIVADPTDDASRAFKIFVHTYASLDGGATLRRDWGYVGLFTAPAPEGPWSTTETPLLGWKSSATISTAGVAQVLTDVPDLADCVAFTEPGAILVGPSRIDLALACVSFATGAASYRIVLLRSTNHAARFSYVSTLLVPRDEACLASPEASVNGADLFAVGGKEYLIVTPLGPLSPSGSGYTGCLTIPMADPDAGAIARTPSGAPQVARWLVSDDGAFTGPCTYAEGATASGYLVPMAGQQPGSKPFRVLASTIAAP